ncbi:MAG: TRAP transporter substrate-binding protein [Burkholderiales bacterium]
MTRHPDRPVDRRRFLGGALGAAGLGAGTLLGPWQSANAQARASAPNKITLRFATITAESFPYVDGARRWKQLVEERTNGTVEMQIFHSAQLGDERTINEGILAGSIHAGIGAGAWAGFVPLYNVVQLPFLIPSLKAGYQLADGVLGERIAQAAEGRGYKVLAYFSAGDQHFQTRTKPIRGLADIKGLKIRVIENRALVDGFRALGAVPTPLPYPQIYTALQQGTVDGTANDVLSVTTLKMYEVAKHFTVSAYVAEPRPVIMSKGFFDGLPKDVQQVLAETAREAANFERQVFDSRMGSGIEEAKKNGMTFYELTDRPKWIDAVRPVWKEFGEKTPGAAELIQAIQKAG